MIGASIGNYRVVERIGDGGMGTVYRAMDEMLDREVALKVMRPELSRQAALNERFRQEAIALARLNHPNIAAVYGLERNGEDLVMVMEYVRGETLESIVQRSGRLVWSRAFELCRDVLSALEHAHDKGVVHRDIKPANIMLARDGTVKVMDFGIARIMGRSRQTRVGAAVGTPMYMSPEQLKGEDVDGRSDLYSSGAVVFELVTGRMAFEADSDYELMMKQLNEPPPPVRTLLPEVPAIVDAVLQRCMAKQREHRYRDAREMRDALVHALASMPAVAAPRRPAPETRLAPDTASHATERVDDTKDIPQVARPQPVAETRLAPEPAVSPRIVETRLASDVRPVGSTPATPTGARAVPLLSDWRVWSGIAALLTVIALVARGMNAGDDVTPARDTTVVARAESVSAPVRGSLGDTTGRRPNAVVEQTGASTAVDVSRSLTPKTEEPRLSTEPGIRTNPGVREDRRPSSSEPRQPDRTTPTPTPAPPPPPERTEPRQAPAEPATSRADDAEAARTEIASAVAGFGEAVSGGQEGRVGSVLRADAELERQWMDLMKERRLLMDVAGAPDIDVSGNTATARFSATLNVRSAFGANRRRTAQFVAELARRGGAWQVTSVRPVGAISLK